MDFMLVMFPQGMLTRLLLLASIHSEREYPFSLKAHATSLSVH